VDARGRLVGAAHRQPHRTELGLDAAAIGFGVGQGLVARCLVGDRGELAVLRDPIEVGEAGALRRKRRRDARVARALVAHQLVGPLLQGVVGVVGLPLDHGGGLLLVARRRRQRAVEGVGVRRLRERAGRCDQQSGDDHYDTFHSLTSSVPGLT